MARERVVSRTVSTRVCVCKCANLSTGTVEDVELKISATVAPENVVKALAKEYNTQTFTVLSVVTSTIEEQIWAMPETEFLKYAKPMSPDRKFVD